MPGSQQVASGTQEISLKSGARPSFCLGGLKEATWRKFGVAKKDTHKWLRVNTNGILFWGRCTTHFSTYFSGDGDVHWGYGILTHGQMKTVGC